MPDAPCDGRMGLTGVSGPALISDTRMGMPPASRMASLLALLSAARFWSVPTARTAVVFSGLACTYMHRGPSDTLSGPSQRSGVGCQLHCLEQYSGPDTYSNRNHTHSCRDMQRRDGY